MTASLFQSPRLPIVVAPMAGGPSTPQLVGGAAQAGAFGFLAGGYRSADQLTEDMRAASGFGLYGVNLFAPCTSDDAASTSLDSRQLDAYRELLREEYGRQSVEFSPQQVDARDGWEAKLDAIEQALDRGFGPAVLSTTFGLPTRELVQRFSTRGLRVWATVSTLRDARLAADAGVDALVVQGPAAGGHRSTTSVSEQLEDLPLEDLLAVVAARVGLPLIAAGGIATPQQVRHIVGLPRVVAASCGTAFLASNEAGTSPAYRQALLESPTRNTVVTRAFSGRCARGLVNEFLTQFHDLAPAAYPQVHGLTAPLRRAAAERGDIERISLWAGQGVAHIREGGAKDILRWLSSGL